jgi:hypothetical protein
MRLWHDFKDLMLSLQRQRVVSWLGIVVAVCSAMATSAGQLKPTAGLVLTLLATLAAAVGKALRDTAGNELLTIIAVIIAIANSLSGFTHLFSADLLTWMGIITAGLAAMGKSLFGVTFGGDDQNNSGGSMKTLLALLITVLLLGGGAACAKKRDGETANETRARKSAVYTAQSYTGLVGWSDATEILARAKQLNPQSVKASYALNEKVRLIADQVSSTVQAGKPADAIGFIERGIAEIEAAENNGVFTIKDPAAQERFYNVLAGVKIGLQSLRAVIEATKEPDTNTMRRGLLADGGNTPWWTELIALGEKTALRLWRQSRLDTAPAWTEAGQLSAELASKNAARLTG